MPGEMTCPFCGRMVAADKDICEFCAQLLWVGRLTSKGTGVIPSRFTCNLKPKAYTIGRSVGNSFIIPSSGIPNVAVKLDYNEKLKKFLVEPQVRKGIFVNNKELAPDERVSLRDGDVLRILLDEFTFQENISSAAGNDNSATSAYVLARSLQQNLGYINEFYNSRNFTELAEKVVDAVIDVTHTRRGFLFMVQQSDNRGEVALEQIVARSASGSALDNSNYDISQSFIQRVLAGEGMVIIQDAVREEMMTNTMRMHQLRALVCLPITLCNEESGNVETVGIIYADNFLPTEKLPHDCGATLRMFAQAVSTKYQQWQKHSQLESTVGAYTDALQQVSRFLSDVLEHCHYLRQKATDRDCEGKLDAMITEIDSAVTQLCDLVRAD